MRKEDRYMMRAKGLPYYYDEVLERTPVGLKIYEIFDGKEIKWGVREDYISIYDDKLYKSTPLFENMTDIYGKDKERIIYLPEYKTIIHGKINGSEVLCRIDDGISEENFYTLETFSGKDVKIYENNKETALVKYKSNGLNKCLYFNYKDFRPCSNEFDVIDKTNFFIKNYVTNGKIRTFFGQINEDGTEVKPYGYDFNKQEYILFPLTEDGLINEEEMMDYVEKNPTIQGYSLDAYKLLQDPINGIMSLGLGILTYNIRESLNELNKEKQR